MYKALYKQKGIFPETRKSEYNISQFQIPRLNPERYVDFSEIFT